jgi:hypothetical protein
VRDLQRLFLAAAFVLVLPASGRTAPLTLTKFNFTANYVVVTRQTTDLGAHVDTTVFIFAYSPGDHPSDAPPTATSTVGLYILVRNSVTHDVLYFDTGEAATFELRMTPGLPSGTLNAVIPTRLGKMMKVDLSWIAVGSVVNIGTGPEREELDGYVVLERAHFKERPARVSGSLSGDPIAITFLDVSDARLGFTHQGSIEVRAPR